MSKLTPQKSMSNWLQNILHFHVRDRFTKTALALKKTSTFNRRFLKRSFSHQTSEKVKKAQDTIATVLQNRSPEEGWEELWKLSIKPWDAGRSSPALVDLVQRGVLPDGQALVPGCGTGYDVKTLASPKRFVIGLEISETAARQARDYLMKNGISNDQATIIVCDFFHFERDNEFDLIYDYTFLAALEPSLRPRWAQKMFSLLKVNGLLVTQIFPVGDFPGGPPYAMQPQMYRELLEPVGFICKELWPITNSIPQRQGREWMGLWIKSQNSDLTTTQNLKNNNRDEKQ